MKATAVLPDDYIPYQAFSADDRKLLVIMNVIGLALLLLFGWLFLRLAMAIRPEAFHGGTIFSSQQSGWLPLLLVLVAAVAVLVLHELVHGFFFWLFTRTRPKFGLSPFYAYAAAPDWYLPRHQYLVVGLSPLVVITLAGILLLPVVPIGLVLSVYLAMTVNAGGAVGDILVTGWLLGQPATLLAQDTGPAVNFYRPVSPQIAALYRRWRRLIWRAGSNRPAWPLFHDLIRAYSEPHRHYHNLNHLEQVLATIDRLANPAAELIAVELAAWFHDAVYDPRANNNEAQSAAFARDALRRLKLGPAVIDQVAAFIEATASHHVSADQSALLLDADLAILGADPQEYVRYAQSIRQEYSWVEESQYRASRCQILTSFLERERIYHTAQLYQEREAQARQNLARELEALSVTKP